MPPNFGSVCNETLQSGFIAEGPRVVEFTNLLTKFLGNSSLVPTNSCTTALQIAYRLCGVGAGDTVISTPLTCVASNEPLLSLGADIRWVDCDPDTGMVDPGDLKEIIDDSVKAIVVLHKEGDLARLDEIRPIAESVGAKIVEDAAHAIGARVQGTLVGNTADFACFSFQAIKHITTGDGGLLACHDSEVLKRARALKWFGVSREDRKPGENAWLNDIPEPGYKGNMNDIAASLGVAQMPHLQRILDAHHRNGHLYADLLKATPGLQHVPRREGDFETFWAFSLQADRRDDLQRKLAENGVESGQIHIRNDSYSMFSASRRELPNTDRYVERELCLPCGWWMSEEDIHVVCDLIKEGW